MLELPKYYGHIISAVTSSRLLHSHSPVVQKIQKPEKHVKETERLTQVELVCRLQPQVAVSGHLQDEQ